MTSTEDVVRRYFAVVADLDSTPEQLARLLHHDATFIERPNTVREGRVLVHETFDCYEPFQFGA